MSFFGGHKPLRRVKDKTSICILSSVILVNLVADVADVTNGYEVYVPSVVCRVYCILHECAAFNKDDGLCTILIFRVVHGS